MECSSELVTSPTIIYNLPLETFSYIFTYLDTITCIRNKQVCKAWQSHASNHCGYLHIQFRSIASLYNQDHLLEAELSVKAQKASGLEHVECKGRKDDAREKRGSDRCQLKRTRGHLPNPNVLDGESKLLTFRTTTRGASVDTPGTCMPTPTNKRRMELVQTASSQITVAIRFEQITERSRMSYITSLDLESIRMHYPIPSTSIRTTKCPSKSHPVKKSIQVLDLSSLCQLKKLPVRGCSSLRILRIPSCLEGLDSSACSALKEITFSVENLGDYSSGQEGRYGPAALCVKAMNLNGCRSLTRIQFFEDAVKNITELDMTSVLSMPKALIAQVLKRAEVLKNVSLRYIATDDIITALASLFMSR